MGTNRLSGQDRGALFVTICVCCASPNVLTDNNYSIVISADTRRGCWHRGCSVTSVTCLIFMTQTTVLSRGCRQVHRRHTIMVAAMTIDHTAPAVKVSVLNIRYLRWIIIGEDWPKV